MNHKFGIAGALSRRASLLAGSLLCGLILATAPAATAASKSGVSRAALAPCSTTVEAAPVAVTLGKYRLVTLPAPVSRLVRGDTGSGYTGVPAEGLKKETTPQQQLAQRPEMRQGVGDADVVLLSPTQLYVLGKRVGSLNLIAQDRGGRCSVMDVVVSMNVSALQSKLAQLMPEEKGIRVAAAEDSLILSGEVADAVKVQRAMTVAAAYVPEKRLVNLLHATSASQVMLEVTVAEISKTLLDRLGARVEATSGGSGWRHSVFSNFLTDSGGLLEAFKSGKGLWQIDGEKDDGVVRILAEPNLMAISGQQASFLSGGKIFIPVAQTNNALGGTTITLEEKEFGVGLKFIPTVLDGGRINLKVTSEVSELSQTGSPFTTVGGVTSVLPTMSTRRADTSVQLRDGQSFAIAGLIKNNLTESVKRFPGLGDIPLLGALFRSSEFQRDMTELMFIITPRLVKPLPANYALPTDNFKEPTRSEFLLGGQLEGSAEPKAKPQRPVSGTDKGRAGPATAAGPGGKTPTAAPAATVGVPVPAAAPAVPVDDPVATPMPVSDDRRPLRQPKATTGAWLKPSETVASRLPRAGDAQ